MPLPLCPSLRPVFDLLKDSWPREYEINTIINEKVQTTIGFDHTARVALKLVLPYASPGHKHFYIRSAQDGEERLMSFNTLFLILVEVQCAPPSTPASWHALSTSVSWIEIAAKRQTLRKPNHQPMARNRTLKEPTKYLHLTSYNLWSGTCRGRFRWGWSPCPFALHITKCPPFCLHFFSYTNISCHFHPSQPAKDRTR